MFGLFRKRIHESIAAAAILAASLALHAAWIINLLFHRIEELAGILTLSPSIGPISGMYALVAFVYLLTFGAGVLWLKGRDVTEIRKRLIFVFAVSLVCFFLLTHPLAYTVEIQPAGL